MSEFTSLTLQRLLPVPGGEVSAVEAEDAGDKVTRRRPQLVLSLRDTDKAETKVTIKADRAGLQLAQFGDVRVHGVLVGQVRAVEQDGEQASIRVGLIPSAADDVPENVEVEILPTTLFGQKYISLVEPEDVRWIFLSHDDGDHTGGLLDAMELCPQATLVTNFFSVERLALEKPALPLERMRWIDEGGTLDAGDRTLRLFKPPIFDGPTTRGLFDPTTAAMWIVDTFACLTPGAVYDVHDLDPAFVAEMLPAMNTAKPVNTGQRLP